MSVSLLLKPFSTTETSKQYLHLKKTYERMTVSIYFVDVNDFHNRFY